MRKTVMIKNYMIPHNRKVVAYRAAIATAFALIIAGTCMFQVQDANAQSQKKDAISCASSISSLDKDDINIDIEDSSQTVQSVFGSSTSTDNDNVKEALSKEIKDKLGTIGENDATTDGAKTVIGFQTESGANVSITVVKNQDGTSSILSIDAKMDATATSKSQELANSFVDASQSDRDNSSVSVQPYSEDRVLKAVGFSDAGISSDGALAQNEDKILSAKTNAITSHLDIIAPKIVLAVPAGFTLIQQPQQTDKTADNANLAANAGTTASTNNTNTVSSNTNISDTFGIGKINTSTATYKDASGATITSRVDNLDSSLSKVNGEDIAQKMLEYWKSTATEIASGASQSLKNKDNGFQTSVFYEPTLDMWGYAGYVVFTDGTRDITYNKVVFVNSAAGQMYTVSYRQDIATTPSTKSLSTASNALSKEAFWQLFYLPPLPTDIASYQNYSEKLKTL